MAKTEMMDNIIRNRGFEDEYTIWFCGLCEDNTMAQTALENAYIAIITMPIADEDE